MANASSQWTVDTIRELGTQISTRPPEWFDNNEKKKTMAAATVLVMCVLENEDTLAGEIIAKHGKRLLRSGVPLSVFPDNIPEKNHPFTAALKKMGAQQVHALDALAWNDMEASKFTVDDPEYFRFADLVDETFTAMDRTHLFSARSPQARIASLRENQFVRQARHIAVLRENMAFLREVKAFEARIFPPESPDPERPTARIVKLPCTGPDDGYILR